VNVNNKPIIPQKQIESIFSFLYRTRRKYTKANINDRIKLIGAKIIAIRATPPDPVGTR
jgi:hypothetical protein